MKKRLRKKYRLGEFYELVLHAAGTFSRNLTDKEVDDFIDSLCDFVDEIGITFVGVTCLDTFHYSFMGLYTYKNRLTTSQITAIKENINSFDFINELKFEVVKTTDMED